ncbi:hypothetical protein NDU88_007564 [Pleurodeles waltl]|uniref:Uncharacterized protein n=1 Tax=Pleurodeles waltl TaxID=8319 RepID=A0AAV7NTF1_PLEWA|nr:hypothetical protein NDU88_007564 [Pleurodeles waltl]
MPGKAAALRPGPRSLQRDRSGRRAGHQADRCSARRRRCASASGGPAAVIAPLLASWVCGAKSTQMVDGDFLTRLALSPGGTSPPVPESAYRVTCSSDKPPHLPGRRTLLFPRGTRDSRRSGRASPH